MDIKGKVHEIGVVQQVSETFKKRDLVVEYAENPTYPEYIRFELLQDKVDICNGLSPGDEVSVSFNLRGRPYTDKTGKTSYFNSLVAWRLDSGERRNNNSAAVNNIPDVNTPPEEDDLPF